MSASLLLTLACGSSGTSGGQTGAGGGTGSGGSNGSGGAPIGSGGAAGVPGGGGGAVGTGGRASAGGSSGTGGRTGTGGAATGGATGTGGRTGTGGVGTGGVSGTGGAQGTGGSAPQTGLPAGVTHLFPAPNGTGLCPDPSLRLTFPGPPTLGTAGRIQVFTAAGTSPVATVDMAAATVGDVIGGTTFVLVRPVFVDGNDVVIYLKTHATGYGQTYYVNIDAGAIVPPGGGTFSLTGATAWRFSTAAAVPGNLAALTVALDGTGQFCSVQGATDALPAGSTTASTITISPGMYHEIMHVQSKSNLTLRGLDRKQTIILGTNNNTQQGATASTSNRSLLGFDSTNGLTIDSLTIHNLTPQNGSQAEALRLQNCDKCVVRNSDILSLQDTLLWSGRVYATNCYIAGNVDYIWGTGAAYFNNCEIHTVGRSSVLVQARNAVGASGYVFVDSKLTADVAATNNNLARIDATVYPGSHVAFINCQMTNISSAGWMLTAGTVTSSLRFWEYQSTTAAGAPVATGLRLVPQITAAQAAMMRDPTMVLGGWQPPP